MRRALCLVLVAMLLPAITLAQKSRTDRSDGIDAFLRGDYQRAAEIFDSLTSSPFASKDETAAFFLGAMYENGFGVPKDDVRACAMYMAERPGGSPFGRLNEAMSRVIRQALSPAQEAECRMLGYIGFHHGFEPETFTIDPGYWISFELSAKTLNVLATVAYQGQEKEGSPGMDFMHGVRFLPIKHTALDVRGRAPARRHFFETFAWYPQPSVPGWELRWWVSELVRDDLINIGGGTIATVQGTDLPGAIDLRRLAAVRVNRAGEAEWAVLAGPDAHSEVIETDVERQEQRAERARKEERKTADEKLDWNQARDVRRPPSFNYVEAEGCGNVFGFGWSADRMEAVAVSADKTALGLSTAAGTFELALRPKGLEVAVHVFEQPKRSWPFCTDLREPPNMTTRSEIWKAVSGRVTIRLSPPGIRAQIPFLYRVWIQIETAEFVSAAGVRVRMKAPINLTAVAGGMFG